MTADTPTVKRFVVKDDDYGLALCEDGIPLKLVQRVGTEWLSVYPDRDGDPNIRQIAVEPTTVFRLTPNRPFAEVWIDPPTPVPFRAGMRVFFWEEPHEPTPSAETQWTLTGELFGAYVVVTHPEIDERTGKPWLRRWLKPCARCADTGGPIAFPENPAS